MAQKLGATLAQYQVPLCSRVERDGGNPLHCFFVFNDDRREAMADNMGPVRVS